MKKVGIFSGTFDPIHDGHISFAKEAIKRCKLDKVFFLVEPRPRRKQGVKAMEHRLAMLQIAIDQEKLFGTIVLQQARFNVAETLPVLRARFKGARLYMLIGEDVMMHLVDWPHVDELLGAVHFVIGTRKYSQAELTQHITRLQQARGLVFDYTIFTAANTRITSSNIRAKLRRGQQPAGVNSRVLKYINQHNLYSSSTA